MTKKEKTEMLALMDADYIAAENMIFKDLLTQLKAHKDEPQENRKEKFMGTNMAKMQEVYRKEAARTTSGGSSKDWGKLAVGPNRLRLLPPAEDMESVPFYPTPKHFIAGKSYSCGGLKCPVCQNMKLQNRIKDDKARKAFWTKWRATPRYTWNALIDGEIKMVSLATTVNAELVQKMLDPEIGDVTDLAKGFDVNIIRIETNGRTSYSVEIARKSTAVSIEGKKLHPVKTIFEESIDLEELGKLVQMMEEESSKG